MWGGNQISDEWGKGEFVFERSGVRVSGGSEFSFPPVRLPVSIKSVPVIECVRLTECWITVRGWMLGVGIVLNCLQGVFGVVGVMRFERIPL